MYSTVVRWAGGSRWKGGQASDCTARRPMRRQQGGGRGGSRTHHNRPWWVTDKSQISPPTGGAARRSAAPGAPAGDSGNTAGVGGGAGGAGGVSGAPGTGSGGGVGGAGSSGGGGSGSGSTAPRPLQSPAEGRRRDPSTERYSHKVRGADAADRRRDQIGRTPPGNTRDTGLRGPTFSPSRAPTPTYVLHFAAMCF